jgi:hypothetical protein
MVARAYESLGGIGSEQTNLSVPYSPRGNDGDAIQTFVFECDPGNPFTGIVHFQGSNSTPPTSTNDKEASDSLLWVDLFNLDIDAEGGTFFVEPVIEVGTVRIVCKVGNYTSGTILQVITMR